MKTGDGKRVYGLIARCSEELNRPGRSGERPRQCGNRRGHGPDGLYCKRHAKKLKEKTEKTR
jgi:hypothetical protein